MRRIYAPDRVEQGLNDCMHGPLLRALEVPVFLIEYGDGERILPYPYFQIILSGDLTVSLVRADGSAYSLSMGGENYIIGEMELFAPVNDSIMAVAQGSVTALALDAAASRKKLMEDAAFLRLVASTVSGKLNAIISHEVTPTSLSQRVLNFMEFKCAEQVLCGVEKAAFRLHCSPRQLQRILNRFEREGVVHRLGKGCYALGAGQGTAGKAEE